MSPEAQRIALAELDGWKDIRYEAGGNIPYGTPDDDFNRDVDEHRKHGQCGFPSEYHREEVPDYLHDLNAIHKLETALSEHDQARYQDMLAFMFVGPQENYPLFLMISATAAQRAEAFLRTLDKWKEDE